MAALVHAWAYTASGLPCKDSSTGGGGGGEKGKGPLLRKQESATPLLAPTPQEASGGDSAVSYSSDWWLTDDRIDQ